MAAAVGDQTVGGSTADAPTPPEASAAPQPLATGPLPAAEEQQQQAAEADSHNAAVAPAAASKDSGTHAAPPTPTPTPSATAPVPAPPPKRPQQQQPPLRRHVDATGAWRRQQQLQQLAAAVAALPDSNSLPVKVVTELSKAMALLQQQHQQQQSLSAVTFTSSATISAAASGDDAVSAGSLSATAAATDGVSGADPSVTLSVHQARVSEEAAVTLAAEHIQASILQQLQPTVAVAACVHAHLFAAWVRGGAAKAVFEAAANSSSGNGSGRPGSRAAPVPAAAATPADPITDPSNSSRSGGGGRGGGGRGGGGAPLNLGVASCWALSTRQYAALVHRLDMLPLLLDHLAWLQPSTGSSSSSMPWSNQQQRQQVVGVQPLLLLVEAAFGCPSLASQLLQQLLAAFPITPPYCSGSSGSSSRLHPSVASVLLSLWHCCQTGDGGGGGAAGICSPRDRLCCLQSLCSISQQLLLPLPVGQQQEQQQEQQQQGTQQQQPSVQVPTAVLALLLQHSGARDRQQKEQHDASIPAQEQHQQQQEQGRFVHVPEQQLLAVVLQLLDDVLCTWGHTWYTAASTSVAAAAQAAGNVSADVFSRGVGALTTSSSSSCCQVGTDEVSQVHDDLAGLQKQLQALLPQLLAQQREVQQQQPQQQQQHSMLEALPVLSHQLVAHATSRVGLTLMLAAMQQQQQSSTTTATSAPAAAAAGGGGQGHDSVSGHFTPATTLQDDPFSLQAQQLLQCGGTCDAAAAAVPAGNAQPAAHPMQAAAAEESSSSSSNACQHTPTSPAPCWQCCLRVPQGGAVGAAVGFSRRGMTSTGFKGQAAGRGLRQLPCSQLKYVLNVRSLQQQQQQDGDDGRRQGLSQAPVFGLLPQPQAAAADGGGVGVGSGSRGGVSAAAAALNPAHAATHVSGLIAAWLTPGFSLDALGLQLPTTVRPPAAAGSAVPEQQYACSGSGSSSSSSSSVAALMSALAAAAGTDCYGPLMVSGCLLSMLLHVTVVQQAQERQWTICDSGNNSSSSSDSYALCQWQCDGLQELLLSMLCTLMPEIKDPQQQQVLLTALNPSSTKSQQQQQQQPSAGHSAAEAGTAVGQEATPRSMSPWAWLRDHLSCQHSPALAAAASRGLIAASNRLVKTAEDPQERNDSSSNNSSSSSSANKKGKSSGSGGAQSAAAAAVVLPQQQQEALVAAELMQALLLYGCLWPQLTVARLLTDGMHNRSQQPLVVKLLNGLQPALQSTPPLPQQQQQQQLSGVRSAESNLLLQQLQALLLPPAPMPTSAGNNSTQHPHLQQQQQQTLQLSEAQRDTAVALVLQLVAAGLVSLQQSLQALCSQPLLLLWQYGWQYACSRGSSSGNQHLRMLLLLAQELPGMAATAATPTAATASAGATGSALGVLQALQQLTAPLPACCCPLDCPTLPQQSLYDDFTAPAVAAAAAVPANGVGAGGGFKWLLLSLCRLQQLLQEQCCAQARPDYKGITQAAAVLEALVASAAAAAAAVSIEEKEWQQLSWQQQLLLSQLMVAAHSSSSRGCDASLVHSLQPASLLQQGSDTAAATAAASIPTLLLDCCRLAATDDAYAVQLTHAVLLQAHSPAAATATPGLAAAAEGDALSLQQQTSVATSQLIDALAAAAVKAAATSSAQQLKQGIALALGQFLPWAPAHEAARVLLRLVPALLAVPLTCKQQAQQHLQQQQVVVELCTSVWSSTAQLVCKAVVLFLMHGKWPSNTQQSADAAAAAAAAGGAANGGGVGDVLQAKQLAAEQCFRHLAVLMMRIATVAEAGSEQQQQQQQALKLLQACTKELCALVASVSAQFDCTTLQPVLLQLMMQLCGCIGQGSVAVAVASGAHQHKADGGGDAAAGSSGNAVSGFVQQQQYQDEKEASAEAASTSQLPPQQQQQRHTTTASWESVLLPDGTTSSRELVEWLGVQLKQLPASMQGLVGPGLVHVLEQQLAVVLCRGLVGEEVDCIEALLLP